ncbi:hypothetical protein DEJ16_12705 [Curtobacterium sp. MCJR17_055]|uniref:hypothetical protein n=1 Tax=unclassified Curtobacterium TaxID=257496 RepID=UPI000D853300|nr:MULTISPECIES: hypothetical protein [unclassified Curtobacterium]PYY34110.1 hypothetical protein DEI87_10130 [Curtobacterium sp. MCBD17_029]PYY53960.1 hypothetical protein DEJ16_12705 [Curtobacterium sp. MCJR17_055]PYY59153.1 hypothetical protein DEJ26_09110 [Curtobacterium sp. MCPF17_015]WIB34795.1 hypothetical protein DEJ15_09455 [Curtobacterium sp. MCJR17_043]
MSTPELIGTREASERLGESIRQTIRRVEAGTLEPVAKMPGLRGAYVFNAEDIARLADDLAATA